MKVKKLSKSQIEEVKKIVDKDPIQQIYKRKNYINKIINDFIFEDGFKNIWIHLPTQWGKSILNGLTFSQYQKVYNEKIHAIYPEIRVADDAKKLYNVNCHVINSYYKIGQDKFGLLLIDEVQYALNKDSKRNYKVFELNYNHLVVNAAHLEKEQIKTLEEVGIEWSFEISLLEGLQLGLIPEFETLNIPIDLTFEEKKQLLLIQKDYNNTIDRLYPFYGNKSASIFYAMLKNKQLLENVAKVVEIEAGKLIYIAIKYSKVVSQRKELLKGAKNKIYAILRLVKLHKDEKGIIFTHSQKFAEEINKKLPNSVVYTSKTPKSNLENFRKSNELKQIIVVGKATVGNMDNKLSYAIHVSFESKPLKAIQKRGRILSIDEENIKKSPKNYCLYVPSFTIGNETIESQELKWLKDSQKGQPFISYTTIENIESQVI